MITKDSILKFTQDPEWENFQALFNDYIKVITDLKSLDLTQPAEVIKAEILVRKQTHERLRLFLDEMTLLKLVTSRTEENKNIGR